MHGLIVPFFDGKDEWRVAMTITEIDVGTVQQQQLHSRETIDQRCHLQSSESILLVDGAVDIKTRVLQDLQDLLDVILDNRSHHAIS